MDRNRWNTLDHITYWSISSTLQDQKEWNQGVETYSGGVVFFITEHLMSKGQS